MNNLVFSPSTSGFYIKSNQAAYEAMGTWPDDVTDIDSAIAAEFQAEAPEGKTRGTTDGMPAWVNIPDLSKEELVAAAEEKKQQLIDAAMQSISVIQLKLQAGRTLNDADKATLNMVLDYIDAVSATDISTAPIITWPTAPAAQAI